MARCMRTYEGKHIDVVAQEVYSREVAAQEDLETCMHESISPLLAYVHKPTNH
jgi:hypothetical protein